LSLVGVGVVLQAAVEAQAGLGLVQDCLLQQERITQLPLVLVDRGLLVAQVEQLEQAAVFPLLLVRQ
jgi:hypothetical protein